VNREELLKVAKPILFNTEMELIKDLGMSYPKISSKQKVRFGLYKCPICNEVFKTRVATVKNGTSTKCRSCQVIIKNTSHGDTKTRLYNTWARMKYRCNNKNNSAYKWYGAKGTSVCKEWDDSFENFKKWALENGYKEDLVLDKDILCGKHGIFPKIYSPDTCLWITVSENSKERNGRVRNAKV